MHSGFPNLRSQMPMNIRREPFVLQRTPEVEAEIARIVEIWGAAGGPARRPYSSGASPPPLMFAPVATRFHTYGVPWTTSAART